MKTSLILFSHSLIISANHYLQDLGSESALSIMVQKFTWLQNGTLLGLSVPLYAPRPYNYMGEIVRTVKNINFALKRGSTVIQNCVKKPKIAIYRYLENHVKVKLGI